MWDKGEVKRKICEKVTFKQDQRKKTQGRMGKCTGTFQAKATVRVSTLPSTCSACFQAGVPKTWCKKENGAR